MPIKPAVGRSGLMPGSTVMIRLPRLALLLLPAIVLGGCGFQLRGEAHPAVQVKNCRLALAHGTGGLLGNRHGSATLIMERV